MQGIDIEKLKYKYLVAINLLSILLFKLDKKLSQSNFRNKRIPERFFHIISLLGGSPGSLFSIYYFKHKNRKKSFLIITYPIIIAQIYLLVKYK